jgi:hypothetical protein
MPGGTIMHIASFRFCRKNIPPILINRDCATDAAASSQRVAAARAPKSEFSRSEGEDVGPVMTRDGVAVYLGWTADRPSNEGYTVVDGRKTDEK